MEEILVTKSDKKFIKSESIINIAKALSIMQSKLTPAVKDSDNPYFKSKYADLSTVWESCRKELTDNGLSIVQIPTTQGKIVTVTTILLHITGEFLESDLSVEAKDVSPQAVGSAITYARRYSMSAMLGICSEEDDDGNEAQSKEPKKEPIFIPKKPVDTSHINTGKSNSIENNKIKKEVSIEDLGNYQEEHFEDAKSIEGAEKKNPTLLKEFADVKKILGDELYYKYLGLSGYEHSNLIPVEIREIILKGIYDMADGKITQSVPSKVYCPKCNKPATTEKGISWLAKDPNNVCYKCSH